IVGENWALVGDSAGFIDPVFSSGLLIGMEGGMMLAKALLKGTTKALQGYQESCMHHLKCWHEIAGYFYDGRLFNSAVVGEQIKKRYPMLRMMMPYFEKQFSRIFTGAASSSNVSIGMLRWVLNWSDKKQ